MRPSLRASLAGPLALAVLLFLLSALPTRAIPPVEPVVVTSSKESEVRFRYPAGQVFKHDRVFPLVVEITNRSQTAKTFQGSWSMNLEVPSNIASVKLEPGDQRRLSLFFPRNEASSASTIEFNKVPYSTELQSNPRTHLTGLLSPAAEKFDYLRTLKLEVDPNVAVEATPDGKPKLVPLASLSILDPELVPEGWPMLSCLDVIIAYDLQSMALSKLQKNALLSWVCQGGRLVLVSDGLPEEFRGTPFEQHLPLKPDGVVTEKGTVQLVGQLSPGAETLMEHNGRPLLLRKKLMRGSVFLVTAPLKELGPLSVEQAEKLWRLALPKEPDNTYNSYNGMPAVTANTIRNIPELPRAGPGWVALFLLVYALIVGPVNLGILRRKDKMLWSFATVPAIALLFAGGAYVLNRASRSSVPVLRELGLLQVRSGDQRGYGQSEGIFFSPSAQRYGIDCSPEAICHSTTYNYEAAPFGMYTGLTDGGLRANITMGTWDVFMVGTESLIDLSSPLTGRWEKGVLTIDSPLSCADQEALVYDVDKGITNFFTLKGGKQVEKLTLSAPNSGYTRFSGLGTGPDSEELHPGREALLNALGQQQTDCFVPGKAYLLFWTDKLRAPVTPQAPAVHRAEYMVLLELES